MDDPMQIDSSPLELPHELTDLTLAIAVRLHLRQLMCVWPNDVQAPPSHHHDHHTPNNNPQPMGVTKSSHDDGSRVSFGTEHLGLDLDLDLDLDNCIPDELDILESYLMVVNDLSITQATAVLVHPDHDIVEYCMDGKLEQVRLYLNYAQQGRFYLSDSVVGECIDVASANGDIEVLEALTRSFPGRKFYHSCQAMDQASANGHIDCLEWWLENKDRMALRYSAAAMDSATGDGLVSVLDWWLNSGLELKYSSEGLEEAFAFGQLSTIEWWWANRAQLDNVEWSSDFLVNASLGNQVELTKWWIDMCIPFSFHSLILVRAADEGHIDTLNFWHKWLVEENPEILQQLLVDKSVSMRCRGAPQVQVLDWLDSKGFLIHSYHWITEASMRGHLDALMWLHSKDLFKEWYDHRVMDNASKSGHLHVLHWIVAVGFKPEYTADAVNQASRNGHLNVVRWWLESGFEVRYTDGAVDGACQNGHVEVLRLWKSSGHPFRYSEDAIDQASKYGFLHVLDWWVTDSRLELKYTKNAVDSASQEGRVYILEWWLKQSKSRGLEFKYTEHSLKTKFIPCLDWWLSSGLPLDYTGDSCIQLGDPSPVVDWWIQSGLTIKHISRPTRLGSMLTPVAAVEYWENIGLPVHLEPIRSWDVTIRWCPFPYIEWAVMNSHLPLKVDDLQPKWQFEQDEEVIHVYHWLLNHAQTSSSKM